MNEKRAIRMVKVINAKSFCVERGVLHRLVTSFCHPLQYMDLSKGEEHLFPYASWPIHGGSGEVFARELADVVLPAFEGSADLVLFWNDGQETGLRLREGKVTHHAVKIELSEAQ